MTFTKAKQVIDEYRKEVERIKRELQHINRDVQAAKDTMALRSEIESKIQQFGSHLQALQDERDAVFHDYHRALFEQDNAAETSAIDRRKELDREIELATERLEDLQAQLETNQVDTKDLARLRARYDSLQDYKSDIYIPPIKNVLQEIDELLREAIADSGIKKLSIPGGYDENEYDSYRCSIDKKYAREQKELAKARAKRNNPVSTASDIGAVADTMRKPKNKGFSPSEGWIPAHR